MNTKILVILVLGLITGSIQARRRSSKSSNKKDSITKDIRDHSETELEEEEDDDIIAQELAEDRENGDLDDEQTERAGKCKQLFDLYYIFFPNYQCLFQFFPFSKL